MNAVSPMLMAETETASQPVNRLMAMADLRELTLMLKRRWRLIAQIAVASMVLAVLLAFVLPNKYMSETIVMLDPRKTNFANMQDVVSGVAPDAATLNSEITIITSRAVIDRVINKLDLMHNDDFIKRSGVVAWVKGLFGKPTAQDEAGERTRVAETLTKNLSASNDGRSYTIDIAYRAKDPQLAATIANAFADEYLVDQLESKYDMTQRVNNWLSGRLETLRGEVEKDERKVEDFKQANNLTGVGEETISQQQLVAINGQLVDARAEQSQMEARLKSVEDILKNKGNLEAASTVLSSPLIQALKQQEAEVARRTAELSMRYGDRHPTIINARAELYDIRNKISQEVSKIVQGMRNDVNVSEAKVASLQHELDVVEGRTGEGNQAMVQLRQLQREAGANRSLYEGFLNRFKQVAEQQDMQVADARVIARAEPAIKAYFPKKSLFGLLGLVLGALLGFAVALLLEYFDHGFRSVTEIERATKATGIGMIPQLKEIEGKNPAAYVLDKPLSAYAEALRTVRTALHFSNVDKPPKVIMVTSSVPGEGKTTFCVSLARVLAKSGNRVLLIDADLRRPQIHNVVESDRKKPDLAQVLAGNATVSAALQRDTSGADFITAHTKAPNPQDLLGSNQMHRLIDGLRPNYDIIIVDTPPVMAVSDAAMVSTSCDTSLYLVRWASTPREVVMNGIKQLGGFKIKLAGVVMTQVDLDAQATYGYGDYGTYYGRYKEYYTN